MSTTTPSDKHIDLPMNTTKFDLEPFRDLRMYTVKITEPALPSKAEKEAMSTDEKKNLLTPTEQKLIIDKFTEKLRKTEDDVIQVNHKTFLSIGTAPLSSPNVDVELVSIKSDSRPKELKDWNRVVYHGGQDEKTSVRWVTVDPMERVEPDKAEKSRSERRTEEITAKGDEGASGKGETDLKQEHVKKSDEAEMEKKSEEKPSSKKPNDGDADSNVDNGETTRTSTIRLAWSDCTVSDGQGSDLLKVLIASSKKHEPKATECLQALLRHGSTKNDATTVFLGDGHFGSAADAHIQDVELRKGISYTLTLDPANEVMQHPKPCHQLFFPATSLACFMEKHIGISASEATVANKERLTDIFRGVSVKISGGYLSGAVRAITDFSLLTPDQQLVPAGSEEIALSEVYGSSNNTLLHSALPCVNVGSVKRPFFVAQELCSIMPNQPFKHAVSPTFQRELETARRVLTNKGMPANANPSDDDSSSSFTSPDKFEMKYHDPTPGKWSQSTMNTAKVILVQAGNSDFQQQAWKDFQNVFHEMASRKDESGLDSNSQSPIAEIRSRLRSDQIDLTYSPGSGLLEKCSDGLAPHLEDWSDDLEHVTVVFAMQDNTDRDKIYKAMKEACDGLHVRSIGINIGTLSKKINTDGAIGLVKYCGQIFRKMFARTPMPNGPPSSTTRRRVEMAVAIHVSKYPRESQVRRQKPLYMIAMVLRGLQFGEVYRSSVEVFEMNHGETINDHTADMLQVLLGDLEANDNISRAKKLSPKTLTVLRSGHDVPSTGDEGDEMMKAVYKAHGVAGWLSAVTLLTVDEDGFADLSAQRSEALRQLRDEHKTDHSIGRALKKAVYFVKDPASLEQNAHGDVFLVGNFSQGAPTRLTMLKDRTKLELAEKAITKVFPSRDELSHLFHDDHIGLYESKWPVPTYLARLLTRRAASKMNIRMEKDNGWVREELPEKFQGVDRTLWYL